MFPRATSDGPWLLISSKKLNIFKVFDFDQTDLPA